MKGRMQAGYRAAAGAGGGHDLSMWMLGLLCGLGAAAANEALLLPSGLVLGLAGGLPLLGWIVRRLLRPRRRALVWQEVCRPTR